MLIYFQCVTLCIQVAVGVMRGYLFKFDVESVEPVVKIGCFGMF
ncbi:hypothetical protein [Taylorella equigenitalis]|nr:hypothetical protein [Taylorella equigenitalis]